MIWEKKTNENMVKTVGKVLERDIPFVQKIRELPQISEENPRS